MLAIKVWLFALVIVFTVADAVKLGSELVPTTVLTPEKAKCILEKGYEFVLIHAYTTDGRVNPNALNNIAVAKEAGFKEIDLYFGPCFACEPDVQAREILAALKEVQYGKIWIKIGSKGWREFPYYNRRYLKTIMDQFPKEKVGILVSKFEWEDPFRKDYDGAKDYSLMYKSPNKDPSFDDFVPFGGWKKPEAKLFEADDIICETGMNLISKE